MDNHIHFDFNISMLALFFQSLRYTVLFSSLPEGFAVQTV
jgi:hypothetical protein